MVDTHPAAVRFGKPGKLYIAPLGSVEPTTVSSAWGTGWVPLGLTETGSVFNYAVQTAPVSVGEILDVLAYATTGRNASVVVALAELTYRNLAISFNGGVVSGAGTGDGSSWKFEPPALGTETRVMLGWDAFPTVSSNDLRFIFRQCFQTGSLAITNQKGANIAGLNETFNLEFPFTSLPVLAILGGGALNPV